jgi:hypothetical protein
MASIIWARTSVFTVTPGHGGTPKRTVSACACNGRTTQHASNTMYNNDFLKPTSLSGSGRRLDNEAARHKKHTGLRPFCVCAPAAATPCRGGGKNISG